MKVWAHSRLIDVDARDALADRQRIVVLASAIVGVICLLTSHSLGQHPGVQPWEVVLFAPAGMLLLLNALLVQRGVLSYPAASAILLAITAALLLFRIVMLFVDDTFEDPGQGMFMPVFAYYGVLPLLLVILLPYPLSARYGAAAWAVFATVTTVGLLPHADDQPRRKFLAATLIYVWFGHGLLTALLFDWARQQKNLVAAYFRLAAMERESRTAMAESEQRFRSVYENATVGIGLVGTDECWIEVNSRMAELTGYPIDELQGQPLRQLLPVDERELRCDRGRTLFADQHNREGYSVERRWRRKDGSERWLLHQVRRLSVDAAKVPALLVMSIDITDRVVAKQVAAEHERVREFHFTNTPLAVIEWTPDMRVKRWSARAETMFGWPANEIVGKGVADWHFVHDDDIDSVLRVVHHMTFGRETQITSSNRNYRRDGTVVWCQWHNSILRDDSGRATSLISLVQDVTEQKLAMAALDQSERKLRGFFEQAAVGMALLNADGTWNTVNQRLCTLTGYAREALLTMDHRAITVPEDIELDRQQAAALINGEIDGYEIEKRYLHKRGSIIWVKVTATRMVLAPDQPALYVAVVEDISERKRAESVVRQLATDLERKVSERTAQLQHSMRNWARRNQEQRVLGDMMTRLPEAGTLEESGQIIERFVPTIFKHYGGAIWLSDGNGSSLSLLAQWGCIGTAPSTMRCSDCEAIQIGEVLRIDDPEHPTLCAHLQDSHVAQSLRPHTCAPIMALGQTIGLLHLEWSEGLQAEIMPPDPVTVANCVKKIGLAIGSVRLREELRRQAIRDPLTGLFNRRHFDTVLQRRINEHHRNGRTFSLLMIDIDHFKRINDQHGHHVGDEVLCAVAELLLRVGRVDEGAFRLGGEEFVLLIEDTGPGVAAGCAERMRREVEAMPVPAGDRRLPPITISIGVASYPRDVTATASLLQRADSALYTAKRTGRNRVCHASAANGGDVSAVQPPER